MTHPDPALNQLPAQPAADALVPDESVLSANLAVQAIQKTVVGAVDRLAPALANVERHGGAAFRLRALVALFLGERKAETVQDMSGLVADLNLCRQNFTPDDSVDTDDAPRLAA